MMKNDDVVNTNNFIKIFSLCVRKIDYLISVTVNKMIVMNL